MADNERESKYLMSMFTALSERLRAAEAYFAENPDKADSVKLKNAYAELTLRKNFVAESIRKLSIMTSNSTNTDRALELCNALYDDSIDERMYNTEEEMSRYIDAIILLQKQYPEWDTKIMFAIRNIKRATQRGFTVSRYYKTLRIYVDTVTEYFLWIRKKYAPLDKTEREETKTA